MALCQFKFIIFSLIFYSGRVNCKCQSKGACQFVSENSNKCIEEEPSSNYSPKWSEWSNWKCEEHCKRNEPNSYVSRTRKCLNFKLNSYCQTDEGSSRENITDYEVMPCELACSKSIRFHKIQFYFRQEHESVVFNCAEKSPNSLLNDNSVIWYLNEKPLSLDLTRMVFKKDGNLLVLQNLKHSDSGMYFCASSKASIDRSDLINGIFNLAVKTQRVQHEMSVLNRKLMINCSLNQRINDYIDENHLSIVWLRNKKVYVRDQKQLELKLDGEYTCAVREKHTNELSTVSVLNVDYDLIVARIYFELASNVISLVLSVFLFLVSLVLVYYTSYFIELAKFKNISLINEFNSDLNFN